jgi:glycosyltransferase involved in cell wall biosynthesis
MWGRHMRYGIDGRYIQDHFPGIGRYTYNLIRHLAPLAPEHDIVVFHDPQAPNSRYDMGSLRGFPNVLLVPVSVSPFSVQQQIVLPRLARQQRLSLYHSPYYLFPLALSCPTVVSLHDLIPLLYPEAVPHRSMRWLFALFARMAVYHADQILVDSETTRRAVVESWHPPSNRVTSIPLAADEAFGRSDMAETEQMRQRLDLDRPYVLHVGTNKPHKNLVRLVEAWAALPQPLRAANMVILAGAHDRRYPEPQLAVARLGLGDEVRFLGNVSDHDLPMLYAGALGFVFPSLYEGFGLPVLEAMASGVPVACSNRPSLPEVVGQAALLFDPERVSDITAALQRMLAEPQLRQRLAHAGREQAELFSWSRTAADTLRLYGRLAVEGTG